MIRLTKRDEELLDLLCKTGWLSSSQVHFAFFSHTSIKVVTNRLRILERSGFLKSYRIHRTDQNLYRPTTTALKIRNIELTAPVHHKPPKDLDHFLAVNNILLSFHRKIRSLAGRIDFMFSDADVRRLLKNSRLIPDGMISFSVVGCDYKFLIEYDSGFETPEYFAKVKIRKYLYEYHHFGSLCGLHGFKILVYCRSISGMTKLIKVTLEEKPPKGLMYFATPQNLLTDSIFESMYVDPAGFYDPETGSNRFVELLALMPRAHVTRHEIGSDNSRKMNDIENVSVSNIFMYGSTKP